MLSFPFGNLSHTSILYYILPYIELEYNFSKEVRPGYYSVDDSYIDNFWSYNQHIDYVFLISMLAIRFVPFLYSNFFLHGVD
jgi:hypothetical protein